MICRDLVIDQAPSDGGRVSSNSSTPSIPGPVHGAAVRDGAQMRRSHEARVLFHYAGQPFPARERHATRRLINSESSSIRSMVRR